MHRNSIQGMEPESGHAAEHFGRVPLAFMPAGQFQDSILLSGAPHPHPHTAQPLRGPSLHTCVAKGVSASIMVVVGGEGICHIMGGGGGGGGGGLQGHLPCYGQGEGHLPPHYGQGEGGLKGN